MIDPAGENANGPGGDGASARRAPRGCLMIVGDERIGAGLVGRLATAPLCVETIFDAIGAINAAEASRPVVAALVADATVPAADSRAIEAMRRLDPTVRLIRVVDGAGPGPGPWSDLFDGAVDAPVDPDTLGRLLDEGWLLATDGRGSNGPIDDPGSAAPVAGLERIAPVLQTPAFDPVIDHADAQLEAPSTVDRGDVEHREFESRAADLGDVRSGDVRSGDVHLGNVDVGNVDLGDVDLGDVDLGDVDLGDVDLVEAVLRDRDGVIATAIELIRQQTKWTDLTLSEDTDARGVDVTLPDGCAGRLITTHAGRAELIPWARWLARWLELDRSYRDHRRMAYRDDLTGTWNRRYFNRFIEEVIVEAQRRRRPVTVMVFDIDDFKHYNDAYGHEAGDEILCETVALLHSVIRGCDRVCRIGGDEFAVIFADLDVPRETGSSHPASVGAIARRFQEQICTMRFPKLGPEAPGRLSISGGLATYPWDGDTPAELLRLADQRALESKRKGKNHITFGPEAADESAP